MKSILLLSLALSLNIKLANASDFKILETYKATAEELLTIFQNADEKIDLEQSQALLDLLVNQGVETMNLIGEHKPECVEQYKVFISEIPLMSSLTVNELHERYHDGVGLPSAPKFCYFGRSLIVHPVMSKVLLNGGWNTEIQEEVVDQTSEIIEHLERIEKLLQ